MARNPLRYGTYPRVTDYPNFQGVDLEGMWEFGLARHSEDSRLYPHNFKSFEGVLELCLTFDYPDQAELGSWAAILEHLDDVNPGGRFNAQMRGEYPLYFALASEYLKAWAAGDILQEPGRAFWAFNSQIEDHPTSIRVR